MSQGLWAANDPQLTAMTWGPQSRSHVETDSNRGSSSLELPGGSLWPPLGDPELRNGTGPLGCTYGCEGMNLPRFEPLGVWPCVGAVTSLPGGSGEAAGLGPVGTPACVQGRQGMCEREESALHSSDTRLGRGVPTLTNPHHWPGVLQFN